MKLENRIIERAAALLVDRLLGKPEGEPQADVDGDGDLRCPDCDRPFVTEPALKQHRTKAHKDRVGGPR